MKSFFGNFYRHLAIFIWSHWWSVTSDLGARGAIWCQQILVVASPVKTLPWACLLLVVERLHVVGWGEGLCALVTPAKATKEGVVDYKR